MGKGKGQVCLLISLSDSASVVLLMTVSFLELEAVRRLIPCLWFSV